MQSHVACQALLSMEFSRQETGGDSHSLLQGIFPTQGSNPGLPHCRQILYHLSHQGSDIRQWIPSCWRQPPMPAAQKLQCPASSAFRGQGRGGPSHSCFKWNLTELIRTPRAACYSSEREAESHPAGTFPLSWVQVVSDSFSSSASPAQQRHGSCQLCSPVSNKRTFTCSIQSLNKCSASAPGVTG